MIAIDRTEQASQRHREAQDAADRVILAALDNPAGEELLTALRTTCECDLPRFRGEADALTAAYRDGRAAVFHDLSAALRAAKKRAATPTHQ